MLFIVVVVVVCGCVVVIVFGWWLLIGVICYSGLFACYACGGFYVV